MREVARRAAADSEHAGAGAWALLLAQESGQDDVVFGATVAGRPADLPGVESIVGPFLNTLPLRVEVVPERRLHEWLAALQQHQVEARRHEHAPLVDVQRWSAAEPGVALFDHILVFENPALPEELASPLPGLEIVEESGSSLTNYPLNVVVVPGHELLLSLRWDGTSLASRKPSVCWSVWPVCWTTFAEDSDPRLGEVLSSCRPNGISSFASGTTRRKPRARTCFCTSSSALRRRSCYRTPRRRSGRRAPGPTASWRSARTASSHAAARPRSGTGEHRWGCGWSAPST